MDHTPEAVRRRLDRYTLLEKLLTISLFMILMAAIVVSSVAFARQNTIQDTQERLSCVTSLTADFQAAVGDALSAPPAPNPARDAATASIAQTARKLHHPEKYC